MDQVKKMECSAKGEFIWEAQVPLQPDYAEKPLSSELLLLITTMKGETLCSMNKRLRNSMP